MTKKPMFLNLSLVEKLKKKYNRQLKKTICCNQPISERRTTYQCNNLTLVFNSKSLVKTSQVLQAPYVPCAEQVELAHLATGLTLDQSITANTYQRERSLCPNNHHRSNNKLNHQHLKLNQKFTKKLSNHQRECQPENWANCWRREWERNPTQPLRTISMSMKRNVHPSRVNHQPMNKINYWNCDQRNFHRSLDLSPDILLSFTPDEYRRRSDGLIEPKTPAETSRWNSPFIW